VDIVLSKWLVVLERSKVLDFTHALQSSQPVLVYRKSRSRDMWVLLGPISDEVWAALAGSWVLVSLLLCGTQLAVRQRRTIRKLNAAPTPLSAYPSSPRRKESGTGKVKRFQQISEIVSEVFLNGKFS
jgi:hypothetical protein